MTMDADELIAIISEQRREIMAAETLNSDFDVAFDLQMQEAMNASLTLQSSTSDDSPPVLELNDGEFGSDNGHGGFDWTRFLLNDIERYLQEFRDWEESEAEDRKMIEELDRRIHDRKFAIIISKVPDDEWKKYGDNYEEPYCTGASSSSSSSSSSSASSAGNLVQKECFKVYSVGLVSEERIRDLKVRVAGIGVVICDSIGGVIFNVQKPLPDGELMSNEAVGLEACIEGINAALSLNLTRIDILCDDSGVH